jgi:hypothetical protein
MPLDLSEAVLQRAMAQVEPAPERPRMVASGSGELDPTFMGILGALADGASTYALLKKGHAEDNQAFAPLKGHPAATGLAATGTGLVGVGLAKLLGKKWPGLSRALTANYAAQSIGLAAKNFDQTQQGWFGESSADAYRQAVTRALQRDDTR